MLFTSLNARNIFLENGGCVVMAMLAGWTMFLPLGWWHQVSSLDVCLSFSFSNLDLPNEYAFLQPRITNW